MIRSHAPYPLGHGDRGCEREVQNVLLTITKYQTRQKTFAWTGFEPASLRVGCWCGQQASTSEILQTKFINFVVGVTEATGACSTFELPGVVENSTAKEKPVQFFTFTS